MKKESGENGTGLEAVIGGETDLFCLAQSRRVFSFSSAALREVFIARPYLNSPGPVS